MSLRGGAGGGKGFNGMWLQRLAADISVFAFGLRLKVINILHATANWQYCIIQWVGVQMCLCLYACAAICDKIIINLSH